MNEKKSRFHSYWGIVAFTLLGTLLGIYHNAQTRNNRQDFVAGGIRAALTPPAVVMNGFTGWIGSSASWIFRGYGLAGQNRILQKQVELLQSENIKLKEAGIRYENLRNDMNFVHSLHKAPISADVASRRFDSNFQTLTLSRGSRDGVKNHQVVVNRLGVIGQISETSPTSCVALLLSDYRSSIGVRVQRADSRIIGICRGDNGPTLQLTDLPGDANIKVGDQIITSGFGTVYTDKALASLPHDALIGTVAEVSADPETSGKIAKIKPVASFAGLEEVYILP